jgi:hypothetical protein
MFEGRLGDYDYGYEVFGYEVFGYEVFGYFQYMKEDPSI